MREIEFRVWDEENREMLYQDDNTTRPNSIMDCMIIFDSLGYGVEVRYFGENNYIPIAKFELMQYTGLKDKKGKKIYEGDICNNDGGICEIVWSENYQWGCKIIKGGFLSKGLTFPLWHWDNCYENGYRQLEVIGNVYENPELLTV